MFLLRFDLLLFVVAPCAFSRLLGCAVFIYIVFELSKGGVVLKLLKVRERTFIVFSHTM